MKQEVILQLSNADLMERLEEEKKQLTRLRLNHAVSPLDNPHKLREYRTIIARLQTEIRRRQLGGSM